MASRSGVMLIILALVVSLASSRRVSASCGDYLMPLHTHGIDGYVSPGFPTDDHGAETAAGVRLQLIFNGGPLFTADAPPCHGPNCGQGPAGSSEQTVAVGPERSTNFLSRLTEPSHLWLAPTIRRGFEVNVASFWDSPSGKLFRPPRGRLLAP